MTSNQSIDVNSTDILKSGLIYRLNDTKNLKSPPIIKINKDQSTTQPIIPDINPDEEKHVNERFELVYRSTSSPALQIYHKAILSSRSSHRSSYDGSSSYMDMRSPSISNLLSPPSNLLLLNQHQHQQPGTQSHKHWGSNNGLSYSSPTNLNSLPALTNEEISPRIDNRKNPESSESMVSTKSMTSVEVQTTISTATHILQFVEKDKSSINEILPTDQSKTSPKSDGKNEFVRPSSNIVLRTSSMKNTEVSPSRYSSSHLVTSKSSSSSSSSPITSPSSSTTMTNSGGNVIKLSKALERTRHFGIDSLMTLFSPNKSSVSSNSIKTKPDSQSTTKVTSSTNIHSTHDISDDTTKSTRSGRKTIPTNRYVDEVSKETSSSSSSSENNNNNNNNLKKRKVNELALDNTDDRKNTKAKVKKKEENSLIKKSSSDWLPQEFTALYTAYGKTEVTAPDFWQQVSVELSRLGINKSSKECQDRWFLSLQEAEQRRLKKLNVMNNNSNSNNINKSNSITMDSEKPVINVSLEENKFNAKKKLSKVEIKKLAEDSVKAWKEDDLFDSHELLLSAPLEKSPSGTESSQSKSSTKIKSTMFADIKSPIDATDDSDEDLTISTLKRNGYGYNSSSNSGALMNLKTTKSSTSTGTGNTSSNNNNSSRSTRISRAESGKMNYITNLKKKVQSLQKPSQDSLADLKSNITTTKSLNLKQSRVKDKSTIGMFSPNTGRIKIKIQKDSDSDNEMDDEIDEDEDE